MKYRPEIDGLRAIAVLPVVLFHAGFDSFSGGFVGVDIFFVISGYLITGIILEDISQGTFSISHFYQRRVRRILPALFTVCFVCIPFAWLWMLPDEFKDFSESLAAVSLFSSNFLFANESDYFAPASELKPLLHTWSLAVEEQFYLLFPLLLLMLKNQSKKIMVIVMGVALLLSLALSEWVLITDPEKAFYFLPFRAWELAVGSVLAIAGHRRWMATGITGQAVSFLGLAMVVFAIFRFDESVPFPGLWGMIPVLGTAGIIASASPANLVGRLLAVKPVVAIGLISYSLYLWHQPLFAFARLRWIDGVTTGIYGVLILFSILLGYLSWRFVEKPFRNRAFINDKNTFKLALAVSAVAIITGGAGALTKGVPSRLSPQSLALLAWSEDRNPDQRACHGHDQALNPEQACQYNPDASQAAVLWGDSQAIAIGHVLAQGFGQQDIALRVMTYTGCLPILGYHNSRKEDQCPNHNQQVFEFLQSSDAVEFVVMLGRYTPRIEGTLFDNQEGGVEFGVPDYALPLGKGAEFINDPGRFPAISELFRATIQKLLAAEKKVVLIYPLPEAGWDVPIYLARLNHYGNQSSQPLSTSYTLFKERNRRAYFMLDSLHDHKNLLRIYPQKLFCGTSGSDRCLLEMDGKPLYFDDDHLNSLGSDLLIQQIVSAMNSKGWLIKEREEGTEVKID